MIRGQEIERSLGLPMYTASFSDGRLRLCYPFKLKNLTQLNSYLTSINETKLEDNAKDESKFVMLVSLIRDSFPDEQDDKEILEAINVETFPELIKDIKYISGLSTDSGDIDIKKTEENSPIDWLTAINAIQYYTSNTYEQIQNMTLYQFNNLVSYIGVVINWEYKTSIVTGVENPGEFISNEDFPLYSIPKHDNKKMMTMKDFKNLQSMGG